VLKGIIPSAMHRGYYRFPTIYGEQIAFVCEDDLWTVSIEGGVARRLTTSLSEGHHAPTIHPMDAGLPFVAKDEGQPEVYVMPAEGGEPQRLTYQGAGRVQVVGWTPDGESVIYSSNAARPPTRNLALARASRRRAAHPVPLRAGKPHRLRSKWRSAAGQTYRRPRPLEAIPRRHRRRVLDRPKRRWTIRTVQTHRRRPHGSHVDW
jgi:hypothetical protein